jgi:hypothetical protein
MTQDHISYDEWYRRWPAPIVFRDDGGWTTGSAFLIGSGSPEEATASGFGCAREGETYAKLVRRQAPPITLGFVMKLANVPMLNAASDAQLEELWQHLVASGARAVAAT